MSANRSELKRVQILVPVAQRDRMRLLAQNSKCSVSEVYRRAADAYTPNGSDVDIDSPELEALVEGVKAAVTKANKSMDRAEREVRATIDFYKARKQQREASEE